MWVIVINFIIGIYNSSKNDEEESNNELEVSSKTEQSDESTETEKSIEKVANKETDKVYYVGDSVESNNLKFNYICCEEFIPKYYTPKEGNRFVLLPFEVKNKGTDDQNISLFNFKCYADEYAYEMNYGNDDEISATLSQGKKK